MNIIGQDSGDSRGFHLCSPYTKCDLLPPAGLLGCTVAPMVVFHNCLYPHFTCCPQLVD